MSDTLVLGVGDSYMQGSEAGDVDGSFLRFFADIRGYDWINMGVEGYGNLSSIQRLLVYSDIDYSKWKKKIIIWVPTGINRFCMAHVRWKPSDNYLNSDNREFFVPFPHTHPWEGWDDKRKKLERSLVDFTSTETGYFNFLLAYQMLKMFADNKRFSDIYIWPAFNNQLLKEKVPHMECSLYENMDWDKFITIDGCTNYFQWLCVKGGLPKMTDPFKTFQDNPDNIRTPQSEEFIAPRGHATRHGNMIFANHLNEKLPK